MNLLFLTVVLVVPGLRRLADVMLFNRSSRSVEFTPLFRSARTARIAQRVGRTLVGLTMLVTLAGTAYGR